MKKIHETIPVLIAALLSLVFTACGILDISGKVTDAEETTNIAGTITESSAPAAETYASEETTYEMGYINGGTYINDFLKIGCQLDDNWTFYNEEQLAELSGLTVDFIQDEEISDTLAESLDSGKVVFDMYASSSDGLVSMNITFENLGVLYGITMDEDEYVDLSMDNLPQAFSDSMYENIVLEKTTVEFAGEPRPAVTVTGGISNLPLYETIVCIKKGNYMSAITLFSINEDVTDYLAGLFL